MRALRLAFYLSQTRVNYIFERMAPDMQVESSATPLLMVDEVEQVHRQRAVSLIGHVFQLTYAAILQSWTNLVKKSERGPQKTTIPPLFFLQVSSPSPFPPYTMLIWEVLIAGKLFMTHQTTLSQGEGGGGNMVLRLFTCKNAWKDTFS